MEAKMKNYIIEYKEYWYDCNIEYEECILNIKTFSKEEAEKIGRNKLIEMDDKDNKHFDIVSRTFIKVCEENMFRYDSSLKECLFETNCNGRIDTIKFKNL